MLMHAFNIWMHVVSRSDFSHCRYNGNIFISSFLIVYNYMVHCIVLCGWGHQLSGKYRILSKNFDPFKGSISYTNSRSSCQTDHSLSKIHCLDIKKWRQIVEKRLPWQRRWQFWKIKFKVIAAVLLSWRGINTLILLNFPSAHATEFHLLLFF